MVAALTLAAPLTILVALALPVSRALAVTSLEYFFPLSRTLDVDGQSPGCVLESVPNVRFADHFARREAERAGASPDDYLLALIADRGADEIKHGSGEVWDRHPLATWIALRDSGPARRIKVDQAAAAAINVELERAARREPGNAAPVAAEANVKLAQGDEAGALEQLRVAAHLPSWSEHRAEARMYLKSLATDRGLPAYDADAVIGYVDPNPSLDRTLSQGLSELLAKRLHASSSNPAEVAEVLRMLGHAPWAAGHRIVDASVGATSPLATELAAETELFPRRMAAEPGSGTPVDLILRLRLGSARARALLEAARLEAREAKMHPVNDDGFQAYMVARLTGIAMLAWLGILLAALGLGVQAAVQRSASAVHRTRTKVIAMRALNLAVLLTASWALFRGFENLVVPVGFMAGPRPPTELAVHLFIRIAAPLILPALVFLAVRRARFEHAWLVPWGAATVAGFLFVFSLGASAGARRAEVELTQQRAKP